MPKGSPRPTAGRPKGGRNIKTAEAMEFARKTGITPLEYLLKVMRDETAELSDRIDCAKAAAPYVHSKLTTIDANLNGAIEVIGKVVWGGLKE